MIRGSADWQMNDEDTEAAMTLLPKVFLLLGVMSVVLCPRNSWPQVTQQETERAAELLATLLNAGRVVVERNQPLINDPRKGDKGFTPEVFEQQVADEFLQHTHVDLRHPSTAIPSRTSEWLALLLLASKEVVSDAQFVINQRGIGYKNFIPATFGSQAARKFSNRSRVTIKQTTLNPRNLKNSPDAYEEMALMRLASQPASTTAVVEWIDGGRLLRTMMPIYYSEDCLTCHGNPKGILDISGYPREGAQVGELAGAISIQIPSDHR
jgi:general secretion pathway protein A